MHPEVVVVSINQVIVREAKIEAEERDDRSRDGRSRGDNRGRYDDHQSDRRRSSSYRGNSGDRYVREESRERDYSHPGALR